MRTRFAALTAVVAAFAVFPALSQAAVVTIDGNPLNVSVDEFGNLQARFDGQTNGEFFPPTSDAANAGFHVALYDAAGQSTVYGPAGSSPTPVDEDGDFEPDFPVLLPPAGDNAQRIILAYDAGDLRVEQLIQYREGDREFQVIHGVRNERGSGPVTFSAAEFADLYLGGNDAGTGFLIDGPPRVIGGVRPAQPGEARVPGGGLVETGFPGWTGFEVNSLSTVRQHLNNPTGPAFDGTIVQDVVDNAVGVQWDDRKTFPLEPGDSTGYIVTWRFTDFQVPPPPPEPGETVNVEPEGIVRVKFPRGFTPPGSEGTARAAQANKFQRITDPVQIPVGSVVDTRKGAIDMTSAANLTGGTQKGNFSRGLFKITQRATARPFTTLRMRGGSFNRCRSRGSGAETARRRVIRRLRGSARGRYRTRGRRSSATVRGTRWVMTETCAGTLTTVQRGKVAVRDFGRKRTVTLRKGDRYLARPKRSRR